MGSITINGKTISSVSVNGKNIASMTLNGKLITLTQQLLDNEFEVSASKSYEDLILDVANGELAFAPQWVVVGDEFIFKITNFASLPFDGTTGAVEINHQKLFNAKGAYTFSDMVHPSEITHQYIKVGMEVLPPTRMKIFLISQSDTISGLTP